MFDEMWIAPQNDIGTTGNFGLQFPGICLWHRSQNFLLIGFLNWHQPALCNALVYDDYRPDIIINFIIFIITFNIMIIF